MSSIKVISWLLFSYKLYVGGKHIPSFNLSILEVYEKVEKPCISSFLLSILQINKIPFLLEHVHISFHNETYFALNSSNI